MEMLGRVFNLNEYMRRRLTIASLRRIERN